MGLYQATQALQQQISGGLIQIPCEEGMSSKIRMEYWRSHYWSNYQRSGEVYINSETDISIYL